MSNEIGIAMLFLTVLNMGCSNDKVLLSLDNEAVELEKAMFELERYDSPIHSPGIPIFTGDMARFGSTELNSEYVIIENSSVNTTPRMVRNGYNSILKIGFEGLDEPDDAVELAFSVFRELTDKTPVPPEVTKDVNGVTFRAVSFDRPIELMVEAKTGNGEVIESGTFLVQKDSMRLYKLEFNGDDLKRLSFWILGSEQNLSESPDGAIGLDDIYLANGDQAPFTPPSNDEALLEWLKESSIRYFLWNYQDVDATRGVVFESSNTNNRVSLSGLGYALAIYVLAEKEGLISPELSKNRITAMLNWLHAQNWFDGSGGWHGFPHHYFKPDGSYLWPDVSTIDWAICAAGIRVVRQHYLSDLEIKSISDELLDRPQWEKALGANDKIVMGFDGNSGEKNDYRWGLAFSEETELVYLEAVASGKLDASIFQSITREKKEGFYPSWFGAGFTYNWLQLWTGNLEPFATNSAFAFENDANTSTSKFGMPIMGLTACSTLSQVTESGFIVWNRYISNQGGSISGASKAQVIQISPAVYGAVLALPFNRESALNALHEYVKLGYFHPLLGFPDNIRINNLPSGLEEPVPNWNPYDINIGPIAMAIEQSEHNIIGNLYLNDPEIAHAVDGLVASFNY